MTPDLLAEPEATARRGLAPRNADWARGNDLAGLLLRARAPEPDPLVFGDPPARSHQNAWGPADTRDCPHCPRGGAP